MKHKVLIGLLMTVTLTIQTQNLGTDVESFSTIYTPGKSISLDAVNKALSFDYFNTSQNKINSKGFYKSKFYGTSIKGNENGGLTNLFSSGQVNADVRINLVYGIRTFKDKKVKDRLDIERKKITSIEKDNVKFSKRYRSNRDEVVREIKFIKKLYLKKYLDQIAEKSEKKEVISLKRIIDGNKEWEDKKSDILNFKTSLGSNLKDKIDFFDKKVKGYKTLNKVSISNQIKNNLHTIPFLDAKNDLKIVSTKIDSIVQYLKWNDINENTIKKIKEDASGIVTNKWLFKLGVSGQEFKYDLNNKGKTAEERLKNEKFTALSFEIIFNKQFKYYNFLGCSLKGERANNFSTLEAKEISFTEKGTDNTETFNAFTGDYDTFNRFSLNADYIRLVPIDSEGEDNMYLTINPYLRHFIYSGSNQLKNNTNLGLGVNLFNNTKNKILGGAFIQTNDIFGVHTSEAIGKSITVGLVLKYAFEGFNFKEIVNKK